MIYYVVFAFSIIAYKKAVSTNENRNVQRWLIVSVAFPVLIAALRSKNVGTDVSYYLVGLHRSALASPGIVAFLKAKSNFEALFLVLVYCNAKLFKNIYTLQGIIELLIIVPIYYVIWKNKERVSPALALIVYFFIYFADGLNIMRQSIAISFVILFVQMILDHHIVKAMVCFFIGVGFHMTAWIGVAIVVLYYMIISKLRKLFIAGTVLATLLIVANSQNIVLFVSRNFTFLPDRYLSDYYLVGTRDFAMASLVLYAIAFLSVLISFDRTDYYETLLLLVSFMSLFGIFATYGVGIASRILKYFQIYSIFAIPISERVFTNKNYSRLVYSAVMLCMCVLYWLYNYVYLGYTEIIPYELGVI